MDYVLTVSVSVAAGVEAVTSAAQGTDLAWLAGHRAALCVGMIALVALANLRGIRESGRIFAVPTYLFLFSFLGMIAWGLGHYALNPGAVAIPASADPKQAEGYALQPPFSLGRNASLASPSKTAACGHGSEMRISRTEARTAIWRS